MDELPDFARHCLSEGVKALYITLDEMGCFVYFQKNGKMKEELVERMRVDQVVDTTGCGDLFTGGLAFGYLKIGYYVNARQCRKTTRAQRCTGTELEIYKSLEETEQQRMDAYSDWNT